MMPGSTAVTEDWIVPDWPAAARVRAVTTTRQGGVSRGCYASMNPADHVGDDPAAVMANRNAATGAQSARSPFGCSRSMVPGWLMPRTVPRGCTGGGCSLLPQPGVVCGVLTADCLPVLLADTAGQRVAAVHAGWRGLAAGVIEQAVVAMGRPGETLLAWLGPAIGPPPTRWAMRSGIPSWRMISRRPAAFRQGPDGRGLRICTIWPGNGWPTAGSPRFTG